MAARLATTSALLPLSAKLILRSCSNSRIGPSPGCSNQAARAPSLGGDRVAGSPPAADRFVRRPGVPVGDQFLGLLVELALGPRPEPAQAAVDLLDELVRGPRLHGEQAQDGVGRRLIVGALDIILPLGVDQTPKGRIDQEVTMTATNAPGRSVERRATRAWDGDEGDLLDRQRRRFERRPGHTTSVLWQPPRSRRRRQCSTSAVGPGRPPGMRPAPRAQGRCSASTCRRGCSSYARERAAEESRDQRSFEQADAQIHPFEPDAYDVAISSTGAMFFGDHVAAFTNLGGALRPGGRMVLVTWQPLAGNEWIREISGALAAGRDRPAPPPDGARSVLRSPPPIESRSAHQRGVRRRRALRRRPRDVVRSRRRRRSSVRPGPDGLDARRASMMSTGPGRATRCMRPCAADETPEESLFESAAWTIQARRAVIIGRDKQ